MEPARLPQETPLCYTAAASSGHLAGAVESPPPATVPPVPALQRRQAFKDQLVQAGYKEEPDAPPPASDGEGGEAQPRVTTFRAGQLTSTVTVCAIAGSSDSEGAGASSGDEGSDGEGRGGEAGGAGAGAARQPGGQAPPPKPQQQQQQQKKQPAWKVAAEDEGVKKLSKCSLKVLEKTKLKISGKKGRPSGVPKRPSGAAAGGAGKKGAGGKKGGKGGGKGGGK